MTAGRIILTYNGKNSSILNGNPNINFWKSSYSRYTNFSMQSIELECEDKIIPDEIQSTTYKFQIHRYADLINYMHLTINLPAIYSDKEEFVWIKHLGCSILNYARLYINDSLIEEIDGRYLYIYNSLYNDSHKSDYFNKLTGNIPEMNKPYVNNKYKSYTNIPYTSQSNIDNVIFINKNYNTQPSIDSYQLNIPLIFGCFRNSNNLPLISLSKSEVFIEVNLKGIRDLYTILQAQNVEVNKPVPSLREYWLYDTLDESRKIDLEIKKRYKDTSNFTRFTKNSFLYSSLKPKINANYVFLDNNERKMFATLNIQSLTILNDHLKYYNINGLVHLDSKLFHPIKNFIIMAQRTDVDERNEWMNFSNFDTLDHNPFYFQNKYLEYSKKESNYTSENIFKYLYQFTSLSLLDNNDVSESIEQSLLAKEDITTNFYDNGLVENVIINNPGDYYTKYPTINIDNLSAIDFSASAQFGVSYPIVKEKGTYKTVPNYKITPNTNGEDVELDISIYDSGGLKCVDVIKEGTNYDNIINIEILDTFSISDTKIYNTGKEYTSDPQINVLPFPINNNSRDNIMNLNISDAIIKPILSNNQVVELIIDNIGSGYDKKICEPKIYIGGNLNSSVPITYNYTNYVFSEIPDIYFFDNVNQIIEPKINTSVSGGLLTFSISNNTYINDGNYGIDGNRGYGLSKNTVIRTGKVIDKVLNEKIVNNYNSGIIYKTPKLKLFNKYYPLNLNLLNSNSSNTNINNVYNKWFSDNTFIQPEFKPILSGDRYGIDYNLSLEFNDNYMYTVTDENSVYFNNVYTYNYPAFTNNVVFTNSTSIINTNVLGTGTFPCNIFNNVSYNVAENSNIIIENNTNLAITTLNLADNDSIIINKGYLLDTLVTNNNVNNLYLSLDTDSNKFNYEIRMTQLTNGVPEIIDVTAEYENVILYNYTDVYTNTEKQILVAKAFRGSKSNGINTNQYSYNRYNQKDTIFSFYINNVYLDSIIVNNTETIFHLGQNKDTAPSANDIVNLDKNNPDILSILGFSNLDIKNPISTEIGKNIKSIKIDNKGYALKNKPAISAKNAFGEDNLTYVTTVTNNPDVDHNIYTIPEIKPILDYYGKDAQINLNISENGTLDDITSYISFIRLDEGTIQSVFNEKYYNSDVYSNIYNVQDENVIFNRFCGNNLWIDYNDSPIFLTKITENSVSNNTFTDINDVVMTGILDYGGKDGSILLDLDYGGKGGDFEIKQIDNITSDYFYVNPLIYKYPNLIDNIFSSDTYDIVDNVYFNLDNIFLDINITDSGIGFRDTKDNVSYLKGTLIRYRPFDKDSLRVIRQYNLNVEDGFIKPFTGDRYLASTIYNDSITDGNNTAHFFKGIVLANDSVWGQGGSGFGNFEYPNTYTLGNNVRDYYDIISTDPKEYNLTNDDSNPDNLYLYRLKFIVGGIVDEKPLILNEGSGYGTKIEGINSGTGNLIFDGLSDISKAPHIYSVITNGYSNLSSAKFGNENDEILINTSINSSYQIDNVVLDTSDITRIQQSKIDEIIITGSTSTASADFLTDVYTKFKTVYPLASAESRHSNGYYISQNTETSRCFDSYFYIEYNRIKSRFGLNSNISNQTQQDLTDKLIGLRVYGFVAYWYNSQGNGERDKLYPFTNDEANNPYERQLYITSVELAPSLDSNGYPTSYYYNYGYSQTTSNILVKINMNKSFQTPSQWYYQNQGRQWDILKWEGVLITPSHNKPDQDSSFTSDMAAAEVLVDNILNPSTYISNLSSLGGGSTITTTETVYENEELKIIYPLLDFNGTSFSKKLPETRFGKQLTSFSVVNKETTDTIYDCYINNTYNVFNNYIKKTSDLDTGYMYNISNGAELGVTLDNGNILFKTPETDDGADKAKIEIEFKRFPDYEDFNNQDEIYYVDSYKFVRDSSGNEIKGRNYKSTPLIYLYDKYTDKIYKYVLTCDLDTTTGSISKINIDQNARVTQNVIAIIGGRITSLSLYDYYKIPFYYGDNDANSDKNTIEALLNSYENSILITDRNAQLQHSNFYNLSSKELKIGGNITELLIINGGTGYQYKPNIFASYKSNNKYILDESFNTQTYNYNIVNGEIISLDESKIIYILVNIEFNSQNIPVLVNKNVHNKDTKIFDGGRLASVNLVKSILSNDFNKNYTTKSKITIGSKIDSIKILDIGSEIDTSLTGGKNIMIYTESDNVLEFDKINNQYINNSYKGANISSAKNIVLIPNIVNDGDGIGASANLTVHTGTGGQVLTLCKLDSINIVNSGSNYSNNNVVITGRNNDIFNLSYQWNTINKSLLFDTQKIINYDYIKLLNYNWIFRDTDNIPIIDNADKIDFYKRDIIKSIEIMFDNTNREFVLEPKVYSLLDSYDFWKNNDNNDLYLYSFSIDNTKDDPMGSCNFSHIKNLRLNLKLKQPIEGENYKYNIFVYYEYYNVIEYMNGIGAIKFSN